MANFDDIQQAHYSVRPIILAYSEKHGEWVGVGNTMFFEDGSMLTNGFTEFDPPSPGTPEHYARLRQFYKAKYELAKERHFQAYTRARSILKDCEMVGESLPFDKNEELAHIKHLKVLQIKWELLMARTKARIDASEARKNLRQPGYDSDLEESQARERHMDEAREALAKLV